MWPCHRPDPSSVRTWHSNPTVPVNGVPQGPVCSRTDHKLSMTQLFVALKPANMSLLNTQCCLIPEIYWHRVMNVTQVWHLGHTLSMSQGYRDRGCVSLCHTLLNKPYSREELNCKTFDRRTSINNEIITLRCPWSERWLKDTSLWLGLHAPRAATSKVILLLPSGTI